jgi:hypothetical protein
MAAIHEAELIFNIIYLVLARAFGRIIEPR